MFFRKNKKVLCFGTFDGLHPGHLSFLKQAKKYGNYLTVVVARDENVKKIKGSYPFYNELLRLRRIRESKLVKEAILGKIFFSYDIIKEINPDVICVGYDQKVDKRKIKEKYNLKVVRLLPYKEDIYKSSKLLDI